MSTKTFLWLLGGLVIVGGGTAVYLAMRKPEETSGLLPKNGKPSLPPKKDETPEERAARAVKEMADAAARLAQKINPYASGGAL